MPGNDYENQWASMAAPGRAATPADIAPIVADRGRAQALAALTLRLGPPIHVSLEVGQLQLSNRERLAEGRAQVFEVQLDPFDGALFKR